MKSNIKTFKDALFYLGAKYDRPYAHNTRIKRVNVDRVIVTYHNNPVVTITPQESIFSSCGWKTLTTKERINWFLPEGFRLYQEKSVWYISNGRISFIFKDGITITNDGQVFNYGEEDTTKETIKQIKKYVQGYIKALLNGEVGKPSGGDCWYCLLKDESGKPMGGFTNSDHITSHMEESYFVPSLLVNAFEWNRRLSLLAQDGIARLTNGESVSEWQADITARDVKACLTAYLKHCLGIAQ